MTTNLAIYGYLCFCYIRLPLLSDPYKHVRNEVKRKCDILGIKRDCNWLGLDKVSFKPASKNLVRSKLKARFKIFSALL